MDYKIHDKLSAKDIELISNFLFKHLEEYGDEREAIAKAIDYAQGDKPGTGGKIFTAQDHGEIKGAVVVNKTGMEGYIPENILVYIATHKDTRGKGVGKQLMKLALDNCNGDFALHVEHNNPAKFLYEKLGFTNPYLEMRLKR